MHVIERFIVDPRIRQIKIRIALGIVHGAAEMRGSGELALRRNAGLLRKSQRGSDLQVAEGGIGGSGVILGQIGGAVDMQRATREVGVRLIGYFRTAGARAGGEISIVLVMYAKTAQRRA